MNTIICAKINGFTVELDTDTGDGTSCFIAKGRFSASLQCATDTGVLESHAGEELIISPYTLEAITEWALENGW